MPSTTEKFSKVEITIEDEHSNKRVIELAKLYLTDHFNSNLLPKNRKFYEAILNSINS